MRRCGILDVVVVAIWLACLAIGGGAQAGGPKHAIAMHGEPAIPPDFAHFPYVNPDAPKGGRLVQGVLGTFDSVNPFIVRGLSLRQESVRGYVIESLLARGYNEPFTLYGLLANSVETDDARSFVTFRLDPEAAFSDGKPVTAEDVVFSWQLLRDRGRPNLRTYYSKVTKAEILDARTIRFDLSTANDRELPLILGLMPILAKHAIDPETFEETTFTPLLGSGPYIMTDVKPGQSVTFTRNPSYWGRDRAVNKGQWNFDEVRFEFFREANTYFEAFKTGAYDFRIENDPGRWETAYDFPAVKDGRVVKDSVHTGLPKTMMAFVFNTRRPIFADIRVREAIGLLFDFEWINRNLFYDRYRRVDSYFADSELSSHGRAADAREHALLAPFPGAVRPDIMDGSWSPPKSDGSGRDRDLLRRALKLFSDAGYELRNGVLADRNGKPFAFEFMASNRDEERIALLFAQSLKRAGIAMRIRSVDAVQFDRRRLTYDFDMIQNRWDESLSPGNEQYFYWGSAAANVDGTRNYMGVKSPAVDAMIDAMLAARQRGDFVSAVRALDRSLLSGFYVVPLFYAPDQWVARWTTIRRPQTTSVSGFLPETWWREPANQP